GNGRWLNDQISSLSSGGFTQSGGTVDLTAPGESGWAICGGPECTNYRGGTSDVQLFGGTSQSAPLTAGAAALVIQAYRSTHGGDSPSPARVKHLLTSTASDLGLPTFEQGAGLLDARAAVEAALTSPGAKKAPKGLSSNILVDKSQVSLSGTPGSTQTASLAVRNVGTKKLSVAVSTRDLRATAVSTKTTAIDASSSQTFPYATTGAPWVFKKVTFTVPKSTDRLVTAAIWQGAARAVGKATVTPVVRVSLFTPDGSFATNSRPQGGPVSANYANLDVRKPAAGTWTAVLYTPAGATGYTGDVTLQTTAQQAIRVGSVNHKTLKLKAGQSKSVKVKLTMPSSAGDIARAITLSTKGHQTAVPVVQRAVVPVSGGAGSFKGTITGGNARAGSAAQVFTYAFDVPAGTPDLGAGVTLADDAGIRLEGVLVDPNSETQSIGTNAYTDAAGTAVTSQGRTMQLSTAHPVPGRWRIVVLVINPVTGKELGEKFSGTLRFGQAKVRTDGVPVSTGTALPQGQTTTARVTVTNTGIAPINVQLDARTDTVHNTPLTSPFGPQNFQLP
ncbi:MAG: S8 family serine peptidase, partial [Janthinobacterium lividum]